MALSWRKLRSNRPHLRAINRYDEVRSSEVEETKLPWLAGSELEVWFAELAAARDLSGSDCLTRGSRLLRWMDVCDRAAGPDAAVPGKVSASTYLLHQPRLGGTGAITDCLVAASLGISGLSRANYHLVSVGTRRVSLGRSVAISVDT